MTTLCILILYLVQLWICSAWSPHFHLGRPMFGMKISNNRRHQTESAYLKGNNAFGPSEGYFPQKLDHFDRLSKRTWSQRYFFNFQYRIPGSKAVFLMLGGEGPEDIKSVSDESYPLVKWAQRYGAAVFNLEHRFYGKSHPTVDQSVENLRYLSSRQAIEDIAVFIKTMNVKYNLGEVSWITFGGSYSGALSLWVRQKYPELVAGAVGSSAPVHTELDFWKYLQVVEDAIRSYSNECAENIRKGFKEMSDLMSTVQGRQHLSDVFILEPPFMNLSLTYNDIQHFYLTIYDHFQGAVQYNGDNVGAYKDGYGIKEVCELMNKPNNDTLENLQMVNKYMAGMYETFQNTSNSYNDMIKYLKNEKFEGGSSFDSGARSWTWQTCTEFGYFQSTDGGPNGIFGPVVPLSLFLNMCRDIFGPKYDADFVANAVRSTIAYYNSADGYKGTNVVMPNGSLDPWHALGVYTSNDPSVVWYLINGSAHCADTYPESVNDVPGLKTARTLIEINIGKWLWSSQKSLFSGNPKMTVSNSEQWVRPRDRSSLKSKLIESPIKNVANIPRTKPKIMQRFRKMHLGRPPHGFLPEPNVNDTVTSMDIVTGYFIQPVDHFDNQNTATFKQRYFKNSQWSRPGGPIFLMIGGEGPANCKWVLDENITYLKWAKKFGATVYQLEHRYYGDSIVGGTPTNPNPDLTYLSSLQMLYDVASFIRTVNLDYTTPPKWIAFGGSYSGSLALWMREIFPELVHGAVGSSAPIEAKVDFYEYLEVVESAIRSYNQQCADNIAQGFKKMHELSLTREGRKSLSDTFKLKPSWDESTNVTVLDMQFFFSNIYSQFQGAVQYSGDNTGKYASGYGIPDMCAIMTNQSNEPLLNIAAFNEYMTVFYNNGTPFEYTENSYKELIDYLKETNGTEDAEMRLWTWQTCTEFGYFQSSDSSYSIFGSPTPVNMFIQMCNDVFGDKYSAAIIQQNILRTNKKYGGRDHYRGTNVVIPNGSIDPWHALGKYTSDDPTVVWYLINGTAHCADMYPPRAEDAPDLRRVRRLIKKNIARWIKEPTLLVSKAA